MATIRIGSEILEVPDVEESPVAAPVEAPIELPVVRKAAPKVAPKVAPKATAVEKDD